MSGQTPEDWLSDRATARDREGLQRRLRSRQHDEALIDLAGNDYLGLSRDPRVMKAATDAVRRWGAGSTGSRLVTGTTQLHVELEAELAAFTGAEAGLVFATGYAANLGVITALGGPDALISSDAGNHASVIDACRLASSTTVVTPHADVAAVGRALAERTQPRAIVVTDSVFSGDGDLAPLGQLHAVCRDHGALLIVDEAHALGVIGPGGRGLCAEAGIADDPHVVRTVTLSKSLGSQGGAVLGGADVIDHLVNTARTMIFDTGLAPAAAGAALRSVQILFSEPELAALVRAKADLLATAVGAPPPASAVVSLVLGDSALAAAAAERCRERGVLVGCFRPPSVPDGTSRLRLTARADLSEPDLVRGAAVVVNAVKELS